ncbi:ROK family transcriptional regulator [Nonomuraea sp. NPDC050310]|uniref:ROK family transcriptional regulator n=1 Tax=Nonomuraea sp. NPDC050310 TaxID=3154935 RepID=UPI0033C6F6B8
MRHDGMRARNLALVLGEVQRGGPLSRAALSELTGLTKTTVSKLVGDLLEAGIVEEAGPARDGERGRPGVPVRLSGARVGALGLEVNVDYLAVCVLDLTGTVRRSRKVPATNRGTTPAKTLAALAELAAEEAAASGLTIAGTGLAVPGPVREGVLQHAPHLGWHDVRVDLGRPVEVDNEANLAALGELWFGSRERDFLYVSGEIGIGAGIVVGGELFRGCHGFAGELGHVAVDPAGPPCRCGARGCLEVYAGQDALVGPAAGEDAVAELVSRLESGVRLGAITRAGEALGLVLGSAVHLLDPGRIVLGGIFAPLFPWLAPPAAEAMAGRLGGLRATPPPLIRSRLGADAAVLGAAGQVIRRVLSDPYAFTRSAPA